MTKELILPNELVASPDRAPFAILLVNDKPYTVEAIRQLLSEESDIGLHHCPDPFMALEMAEQIDPTVILLDVPMTELDGFTLCRIFRAHPRTRDKPVIMLSDAEEPLAHALAFTSGASDYLVNLPGKIELLARLRYHSEAYLSKKEIKKLKLALGIEQVKIDNLFGEMTTLTRRDQLTGLATRMAFEERCKEMWNLAMRNNIPISLLMMDVDFFKLFNEHYGHRQGDESLKAITRVFRHSIRRPSDVLARFTGEKFTALLPATRAEGAVHVAEMVRSGVENLEIPHCKSDVAYHLTISLGVVNTLPVRGANLADFLKLAETCLNRSKELGRNRLHVANLDGD